MCFKENNVCIPYILVGIIDLNRLIILLIINNTHV